MNKKLTIIVIFYQIGTILFISLLLTLFYNIATVIFRNFFHTPVKDGWWLSIAKDNWCRK